jgi:SHS2 domain-containing protein
MHEAYFETIDISGDVGIRAYGNDCAEAWTTAAVGMYSLITELGEIKEEKDIDVDIESDSPEGLLVNFLNELIFHFDAHNFIGKRVDVSQFSEWSIKAKIHGEEFDTDSHEQGLLLKAATYHNIKFEKTEDRCEVEVIFDI